MNVLALDYGEKRIGLAIGSTETNLALPYATIEHVSDQGDIERVRQVVVEEEVSVVVVGEPKTMSGSASATTVAARRFAELLQAAGVTVALVDERLTSLQADAASRGVAARSRDEVAATFILQDYLDRRLGMQNLQE